MVIGISNRYFNNVFYTKLLGLGLSITGEIESHYRICDPGSTITSI
jgi:hypothetical protein